MNRLQRLQEHREKNRKKHDLEFLSCHVIIAMCLLAAIGLSHYDVQQREMQVQRRAKVLVESVQDYHCCNLYEDMGRGV